MPRNTKDLENSKKEELEKKVENKKVESKSTPKKEVKTEKKVESKPTSKMAAAKKATSAPKAKSTVDSKTGKKEVSTTKKATSTTKTVDKKEAKKVATIKEEKVEPKKAEVKKVEVKKEVKSSTPSKKVEVKKVPTAKPEKVEPKKAEVKIESSTPVEKVSVKKSTSTTPKSKVAANATKKSTSSKTSTTKKSTSKVTPISDKVTKSETTKKETVAKKASSKTETKKVESTLEDKSSKSKIASLADSLFNKIKQFIAGSQKEEDSKKPNRKAKKLVNQDLTIAGLPEYYDLPYKYNDTVVKILAQTPKRLFIYWDISEKDRKTYIKAFGEDFFDKTYPVLLVHNLDKNYTFEVPVNDFANSWYLDINDSKCQYSIELGRKFKAPVELMEESLEIIKENNIDLRNDYIYITTSNVLEAPNDHILFENLPTQITFRNVKTMEQYTVDTKEYVNNSSMNKLYDVEDLYKAIYKENDSDEIYDLSNPSSGNPTSRFK